MTKNRGVRMGWGAALVVTLVAAWFAPEPKDDGVSLASRVAKHPPASSQLNTLPVSLLPTNFGTGMEGQRNGKKPTNLLGVLKIRERGGFENKEASLFTKASWGSPAPAMNLPPTVSPSLAPVPVAPALPFRVMGRYEESGKSVVFLLQGDQSWVVREGETFAGTYKAERIASNAIHLRYLPLNEVQVLEIGAAP
ncbi:hypothetical protein [Iodobacter ciconiae]|uniref:Uncharacterized protein n=1 Tax=Iodobacter ciconiae TaxID=2496266 RepID=A0A3S8ZPS8_9NEIS|nr:hypothetical protein [Iodobacter ciconiae]AZN35474.1 hypothetical protein EJO50_02615 [Iodobacter ciconiae]